MNKFRFALFSLSGAAAGGLCMRSGLCPVGLTALVSGFKDPVHADQVNQAHAFKVALVPHLHNDQR
jgi:hypothetical protein